MSNVSVPSSSRRLAREGAYQALYMMQVGKDDSASAIQVVQNRQPLADEAKTFLSHLVIGVTEKQDELDALIEPKLAKGWTKSRLAISDLVALRLATFELLYLPGMPPKVSITEAIELAKRYGTKHSGAFVNGVLGNIIQETPKSKWDPSLEEKPESNKDQTEEIMDIADDEGDVAEAVTAVEDGSPEHAEILKAGAWKIRADD